MLEILSNPAMATSDTITQALLSLADGEFSRARVFGKSLCGKKLVSLEVGQMKSPVLFVGGTHGMEWASVLTVVRLACECLSSINEQRPLYGIDFQAEFLKNGAVFVPLLNPDGYDIHRLNELSAAAQRWDFKTNFNPNDTRYWQANGRGVDLNHNFPAGFYKARKSVRELGITRPGPTRYGGMFPLSEPETRAAVMLCEMLRPRSLYTLHSQGEEIYWYYGNKTPSYSKYVALTLASLCGYEVCEPASVASHAGFKDWFINRFGRPGFTIELGKGKNPLPYSDFEDIWSKISRTLFVASIM